MFEFDPQICLSIDLRRFELDYDKATFYPPEEKKNTSTSCAQSLPSYSLNPERLRASRLTITITVRHMISETSHWKTPQKRPGLVLPF